MFGMDLLVVVGVFTCIVRVFAMGVLLWDFMLLCCVAVTVLSLSLSNTMFVANSCLIIFVNLIIMGSSEWLSGCSLTALFLHHISYKLWWRLSPQDRHMS